MEARKPHSLPVIEQEAGFVDTLFGPIAGHQSWADERDKSSRFARVVERVAQVIIPGQLKNTLLACHKSFSASAAP